MKSTRTKLYASICVLLGSAALGAPWTAAQADEPPVPTKTVKFGDLDIQTQEGATVLYRRIRAAAEHVCDTDRDPALWEAKPACVKNAIDNAVKKVNAPYLTALRFGNRDVRLASK